MVLDLHKTAGYSFDAAHNEGGFFGNEAYQDRFYKLWDALAVRFNEPDRIAFELLNEVTDPSVIGTWNRIAAECIRRIRKTAPCSLILVGSYWNNSPDAVKDLDLPADDRVIYNFHCYDPLIFTHQGAYWVPDMAPDFRQSFADTALPADYFEKAFASAIGAAEKNNTCLYCGEYGVIDQAPAEDALRWLKDIHSVFEKYGIGRSLWNYKEKDFGLIDEHYASVRKEMERYL